jgi:Na+-translocating ferredoxin:NAD+ oxidoreductase RNF subunit RnfB
MQSTITVVLLTGVGFAMGLAIFLSNCLLPKEDESLAEAARIREFLPGADCGACGYPGCFAYAQAVAKDKNVFVKNPCPTLSQDKEGMARLEAYLGLKAEVRVGKKAVVHCTGCSEVIADYHGPSTCAAAVQVASGYKECPYACLGFGDCAAVCPTGAISIDPDRRVAFVDWNRCIGCGQCVAACPQGLIELVPANMPQYLGCNYQAARDIPGRKRCADGCIHCKICVKVSQNKEVTWNEKKDLPYFDPEKCLPAHAAIEKCPRKIIKKTATYKEPSAKANRSANG